MLYRPGLNRGALDVALGHLGVPGLPQYQTK